MSIPDLINHQYDLRKQRAELENDIESINEHLEDFAGTDVRRALDKRRHLRSELIDTIKELLDCERNLDLERSK